MFYDILEIIDDIKKTNPDEITDEAIIHFIKQLSKYYDKAKGINSFCKHSIEDESYVIEALKCAYLYRYFTCIANACEWHWKYCHGQGIVKDLISREVNICCIGGGPGTDLIGFYRFLLNIHKSHIIVKATILDKVNWNDEINRVFARFAPNLNSTTHCLEYNVFDQLDLNSEIYQTLQNADIVSMVKFVSEFAHESYGSVEMRVTDKLMPVFGALKPGAMVFYLDNSGGGYTEVFKAAATCAGLALVSEKVTDPCEMSPALVKQLSNPYKRIEENQWPQRKAYVSCMLWQRP